MKTIKSEMVKFPFVIEPTMTIAEAKIFMSQQNLRHLPVVDHLNEILGVVSERDILRTKRPNDPVTTIVVEDIFVVLEDESLVRVVEIMADEKYGSVLIVDSAHELTGIFTSIDAIHLLAKVLKKSEHASEKIKNSVY